MDINRYFRFLVDVYGYFILVEFSGIIKLVKSGKFLKCGVNISRNLKLIDFNGFFKF